MSRVQISNAPNARADALCFAYPQDIPSLGGAPWPWEDDSLTDILLDQVAEKSVLDETALQTFWKELHRVCAHGAIIRLIVGESGEGSVGPFPRSMSEMRRQVERRWRLDHDALAGPAVRAGVSFGLVSYEPVFARKHHALIKRRKMTQREALLAAKTDPSVLERQSFTLIANKRCDGFREVAA